MYNKKKRSSSGNLVNIGNCDENGANVNRWKPDNQNDNLGASFSRSAYFFKGDSVEESPLFADF